MNRSGPDPEEDVLALPHGSKVLIYVIGSLEALCEAGMMMNPALRLQPGAMRHFKTLVDSGFKPTVAEICASIIDPRFRIAPAHQAVVAQMIDNVVDALQFAEDHRRFNR